MLRRRHVILCSYGLLGSLGLSSSALAAPDPSAPAPTGATTAAAATVRLDLDGDGKIEVLEADGNKLYIQTLLGPTSVRPGMLPLPGAPRLQTVVAAQVGGVRLWAIEVEVRRGSKTVAELWVGRAANGGFGGELMRLPLGPQGGDGEYGAAAELSARGLLRWQTRADLVRCDGAPLRLFAERWEPASKRWAAAESSEVPATADGAATVTAVPATATAVPATATPAAAARAADVFRARSTTSQRGADRADELAIPSELDDGDAKTTWKSSSEGRGEVLGFRARLAAGKALRLRVVPGDASSGSAFRAANRPAKLWLIGKGQRFTATLPDATTPGAAYLVALPQPIEGCLSVLVESVHPGSGAAPRSLAISELSIETDLEEHSGGGTAALAAQVARGGDEGGRAAVILARRGDAAATALIAELARAQDVAGKRRLARALAQLSEKSIAPALVAGLREGWIAEADLADAVNALARIGADEALAELVAAPEASRSARVACARALARSGSRRQLALAGVGPLEVRHHVIDGLASLPAAELLAAAERAGSAAATGDLWRAAVRAALHAPPEAGPAARQALIAKLAPQLAAAPEYERRYRLATSLAELAAADGDAAALAATLAQLDRLGQTPDTAAEAAALRQAVAHLVARAPRAELAAALERLLGDADAGVRLSIARRLQSPDGLAALDGPLAAALAGDGWPIVRRAAAAALGQRCQRPEPAAALDRAVEADAEIDVRQDALVALVTCRAPGIADRLVGLWSSGEPPLPVRSRAVTLAVLLGEPKLASALARSLSRWRSEAFSDGESLQLAVIAATALGRLGGPEAAPALLAALDDTAYPEIVVAAATGLGALGRACPAEARAKLQPLTRSDERSIALSARRALALCGSGPAVRSPDAP